MWFQRRLLCISFTQHVSNQVVCDQTDCTSPVSQLIKKRCLRLFGHVARSAVELDHCRALRAARMIILRHPGEDQEDVHDAHGPAQ